MRNLVVSVIFLFCISCSSHKYDYRSKAKVFTNPTTNTFKKVTPAPRVKSWHHGSSAPIPQGTQQMRERVHPNHISKPPRPAVNMQNRNFKYPYEPDYPAGASRNDNQLMQNYYGKRGLSEMTSPNNYRQPPSRNPNQRHRYAPNSNYNEPSRYSGRSRDDRRERDSRRNDQLYLLEDNSFAPGSKPFGSSNLYQGGNYNEQRQILNNFDNQLLDSLISDDPLSQGFPSGNIPAY